MTEKEIKRHAKDWVVEHSDEIFRELNQFVAVGKGYKAGAALRQPEIDGLNAELAEAKEIIEEFLHLLTYFTPAEDEKKLKEKAKTFLNWPIVEMERAD